MSGPGDNKTTYFEGKDIDVLAIDHDQLMQVSGRIGSVNFFEDSNITAIDASEIRDFTFNDQNNKINAS